MALQQIKVPDIGDYADVDVIEINVQVGDTVEEEDSLITLETDKASMEIPAPMAGKIAAMQVNLGDKVSQGDVILSLEVTEDLSASDDKSAESSKVSDASAPTPIETVSSSSENKTSVTDSSKNEVVSDGKVQASPVVRRLARVLNIDLNNIVATGRKGRITKDDCYAYLKRAVTKMQSGGFGGNALDLLPDPEVDFRAFGEIELQPLSRINKLSASNLSRNWVKIPHVTFYDDADITDLEIFRKNKKLDAEKAGIKLTPLSFLIKAAAKVLEAFPSVNSSLSGDGENLVIKKYYHIGFATDTPKGLMVPVIKNAGQKGIYEISSEIMALAQKARTGKLKPDEMKGATFTISSLGVLGTTAFTPIINMPEVAIMGVSKAAIKPVWNGEKFVPRTLLPLSLSADHRVIDGAMAAKFLTQYARTLSDIREILL